MTTLRQMLSLAFVIAALSFTCGLAHANEIRRDGNWWNQQSESFKIAYVVGFLDGRTYETRRWTSGFEATLGEKFDANQVKWMNNFFKIMNDADVRDFGNVTVGQLIDGLNNIFSDYKNRRIEVQNAMTLVIRSMDGTPDAELKSYFDSERKKASEP